MDTGPPSPIKIQNMGFVLGSPQTPSRIPFGGKMRFYTIFAERGFFPSFARGPRDPEDSCSSMIHRPNLRASWQSLGPQARNYFNFPRSNLPSYPGDLCSYTSEPLPSPTHLPKDSISSTSMTASGAVGASMIDIGHHYALSNTAPPPSTSIPRHCGT